MKKFVVFVIVKVIVDVIVVLRLEYNIIFIKEDVYI